MPFQVVELRLDAEDQVIDCRAIPYPYPQRLDAVDTIKKLSARLDKRILRRVSCAAGALVGVFQRYRPRTDISDIY